MKEHDDLFDQVIQSLDTAVPKEVYEKIAALPPRELSIFQSKLWSYFYKLTGQRDAQADKNDV